MDLPDRAKLQDIRPAMLWALGRIGTRVPLDGPVNNGIVPVDAVVNLLRPLLASDRQEPMADLAMMLMARKTGYRHRDLSDEQRQPCVAWLSQRAAPPHYGQLVEQGGQLDREETDRVFGEALPKGLRSMAAVLPNLASR